MKKKFKAKSKVKSKRTRNIFFSGLLFLIIFQYSNAEDLQQAVSGAEVEDVLGKMKSTGESPYLINQSSTGEVENYKTKKSDMPDFNFSNNQQELLIKDNPQKKYESVGYTLPGTFEKSENYLENDKAVMASDFRKLSNSSINITFIKDDFSYESNNDIINKTISEGYKHVKGGAFHVRNDQYINRTFLMNTFWSIGAGVGYNSGLGLFLNGEQSNTTFKLWEVPLDLSLGLEIPISPWFKISGSAGPSVLALFQNRDDFISGEKGKNKSQISYGQFANAQFKVNLAGFSSETAYDLFTSSQITNLYLNLEARFQNYQNFQDNIKISGTSFGIGFTFEHL
jgi:hypothetical protein